MMGVNSDAAEAELEAMGNWIAEANPTRALSFVMELTTGPSVRVSSSLDLFEWNGSETLSY